MEKLNFEQMVNVNGGMDDLEIFCGLNNIIALGSFCAKSLWTFAGSVLAGWYAGCYKPYYG
ncbi:MAG: hypothetical protein J6Y82_09610 [Bacteroidales bacterium]|nr:hypothetical protein [Bacteroidales bacterium]